MATPVPTRLPRLRTAVRESVGGLPRTFWWLWTSTLVNRLGSFVVTFLTLYLTATRGFSPAVAGLVVSAYGLGGVFGAIGGGVLADRLGRRPTLLAAQSLAALATVVLGYTTQPVLIGLVAGLLGLTGNAARPAISAIMADLVPGPDRVRAFSLNYWAINIGFAVSASVAGALAAHGFLILFYGDAITTLLCAVVVFLRIPETRPSAPSAPTASSASSAGAAPAGGEVPRIGLVTVFRDGPFISLVGLTFLLAMVIGLGQVALPVVMGRQGYSASQFGLVVAVNGVLIVFAQIPATRMIKRRGRTGVLVTASLLFGLGMALCGWADSMSFYAVTVVVWTLGEIIWTPVNQALVAELSPVHGRGRYQGVFSLAWQTSSFLAPLASGVMLAAWGAGSVWFTCAVLGLVAAVGYVGLMRGRSGRHLAAAQAAAIGSVAGKSDATAPAAS
ncbi:MDR family MFS transporter [Streptacidiphilus jiangxiensis]|uniref:Dipeptide/tripeptide permease n=1 Tax=Streptacidiphilus jiangxiensis TaxID=235985 RepID=A0A1H7Y4R6_STRJI|nr:MFS transporter [Streptacidiphilus jiangxiensis]SEM40179.1 Dipeptide/tripeptide permease [Streptacidiphilus jiangxiensis]